MVLLDAEILGGALGGMGVLYRFTGRSQPLQPRVLSLKRLNFSEFYLFIDERHAYVLEKNSFKDEIVPEHL